MANRFGAQLRGNMVESEKRVEQALNGQPEKMVNNLSEDIDNLEVKQGGGETKTDMSEVQHFPSVTTTTMLTSQRRTEQAMAIYDHLRDEWMQYLGKFNGSYTVGANVQIPEGIDDRLENITKGMRNGQGVVIKMPKKNLILLALWEFAEKYDR